MICNSLSATNMVGMRMSPLCFPRFLSSSIPLRFRSGSSPYTLPPFEVETHRLSVSLSSVPRFLVASPLAPLLLRRRIVTSYDR